MLSFQQLAWLPRYLPPVLLAGALTLGIDLVSGNFIVPSPSIRRVLRPVLVTACVLVLVCLALLQVLRGVAPQPFIYGQF
jgi:hypothetical protein